MMGDPGAEMSAVGPGRAHAVAEPLPPRDAIAALSDFVDRHPRLFVLTGAGASADSGIPCYRDADGEWQRSPPVLLRDFLSSETARQRYWARSLVGWPVVATARPNPTHWALAHLEAAGRVEQLVTQNVDGLHERAGSRNVIELHGNLARVVCVDCGARWARADIQRTLEQQNAAPLTAIAAVAPDGDADVRGVDYSRLHVPRCGQCDGTLKPDVVFFGEGVPRERVARALSALARADAMLVVGSSLMVYSGYRFCESARALGKPIAAVNLGRTRADDLLSLKLESGCAQALAALLAQLQTRKFIRAGR